MIDQHCHSSSILVTASPEAAFEIMADPLKQGQWAWGSLNRREVEPGIFVGTSVFDGKETWVRLHPNRANLTIDYETGAAARLFASATPRGSFPVPCSIMANGPQS